MHVHNPKLNRSTVAESRPPNHHQEINRKRRSLIFENEAIEPSFIEIASPRSGKIIKWRKGDLIGEGAFAKVYQCLNLSNGNLLAVKSYKVMFN